ncbi:flagellar motor switch protein FliN [Rhizobium halophytocola]|uniref:Flagellar motor switch protein FliN n=1 Tax=Rhizobium halophytocola TaxID=735519 RepID=A0ABS4E5B8_9HYPH|nr:flagellar motor switch protein FliN [Rhizobium halophytocola]MBP1853108.1 flagellar motor switch protein FliN/FliY [Rhizobium halophytocola]
MAPKKKNATEDDALDFGASESDLDQAVGDLRGVLQNDAEGTLPDIGSDFGAEFGADLGDSDAGSSFDADFGGGDFGGGDLGGDFGSAADLGGSDLGGSFGGGSDFGGDAPATAAPGSALNANLDLIMDIPIDVQIVLGSSRMQVSGLMNLEEGAIIALDKKIGEPVEIMVNGRRIARGEIAVLENDDTRFGVKLIEVLSTKVH